MTKSQLIKDIATNKITIEEGLQRTTVIIYDLGNKDLLSWIQNELNGYSTDSKLPYYRKNISCVTYYSGFNGRTQVKHLPLPSNYIDKEFRDILMTHDSRDNIKVLERIVNGNETVGVQLTNLAGHIYKNTGVICANIVKELNILELEQILSIIKNKLLLMLLELEKEFGVLDTLDIEVVDIESDSNKMLNKQLDDIIFSDGKGETLSYD